MECLKPLPHKEEFAKKHSDQWRGCIACKESHHYSSFCVCGRCYYIGELKDAGELGYFVKCPCGEINLWD